MAQPNFQVDGLAIEPGSGQTLTITRQASNGAMKLIDAVVTGGLTLSDMANLSQVTGVLIVGMAGTGAKYTTITSALAAVPATSSLTNPNVIMVLSGVYSENITIEKAGVTLLGIGRAVIQPAVSAAAVTVQAAVSTTPTSLTIRGMVINQPNNGQACVSLVGGAGSTVGVDGINIEDCDLNPSGVGCYTVYANAVDYVYVRGCRSVGVPGTTSMRVSQCAGVTVTGGILPAVQMDYTTAGTIPSVAGSSYVLSGCTYVGDVQSTLSGAGSLSIGNCSSVGSVTVNGNRTLTVVGSAIGNMAINDTVAATLKNSSRGAVAGSGTLLENQVSGMVAFAGDTSKTVTFDVSRPGAIYTVVLDQDISSTPYVPSKSASGFTVTFGGAVVSTVYWTVLA